MVRTNDERKRRAMEAGESRYAAVYGKPNVCSPEQPRVLGPLNEETRPFSYQHLMDAPDPEGYLGSFDHPGIRNTSQPVDQTIALHGEILRNEIYRLNAKIGEKPDKKMKKLDTELDRTLGRKGFLERMTDACIMNVEELQSKVESYQRTARALRNRVDDAYEEYMQVEDGPEDDESYYVDPIALGPDKLDCGACKRQVATVMVMPCKHLSVCRQCEDVITACPVCQVPMSDSVEVFLPYN